MNKLAAVLFATLPVGSAIAADCSVYEKQISGVEDKYKSSYEEYEQDGQKISGEAGASFDVTWVNTTIQFGSPTVTIKDQKIVLGLPQVTMNMQDIRFGTPSVTMIPTKTGQYPEITCNHAVIPSCTVKWSDIVTNVPKIFIQQQDVKTLIPEFSFQDTSFVMGVPEFAIQQQKLVIGLPQFKLKSAYINANKIQDESNDLSNNINATKSRQIQETSEGTSQLFSCLRDNINVQRMAASTAFEDGISKLQASITYLRTVGADPAKVTDSNGVSVDLLVQLADMISKREVALAQFDSAIKSIEDSEKKVITDLTSKPV